MGYNPGERATATSCGMTPSMRELYDTVGLVRNGDRCRVLRRYSRSGDTVVKGHVQEKSRQPRGRQPRERPPRGIAGASTAEASAGEASAETA